MVDCIYPELVWASRKDRVFVTIKVKDCEDADVRLFAEGRLSFKGSVGNKNYALELDLFGKIKPDDSIIDVKPSAIAITLIRDEAGDHWPRLPKDSAKNNRIGLNHALYIDQDEEEEEQQQKDLQRLKDELDSVGKKSEEEEAEDEIAAMMTQAYQVMLYAVVICGWLVVLLGGAITWLSGGDSWGAVGQIALFLQLGGWVEVANVLLGIVSTSARHMIVQVLGRSAISLALLLLPSLHAHPATAVLLAAWCIGDIFRHVFYIVSLLQFFLSMPGWLLWARYTISPLAYLTAVCAELALYYAVLPEIDALPQVEALAAALPPAAAGRVTLGGLALGAYLLVVDGWGATGVLAFFYRIRRQKLGQKKRNKKKQE